MEMMKIQLVIAAICVICVTSYPAANSRDAADEYLRQYFMTHDAAVIPNDVQDDGMRAEENMRDDDLRAKENYARDYEENNYQSDDRNDAENYDRNSAAAEARELLLSRNNAASDLWDQATAAVDLNAYDADMERRLLQEEKANLAADELEREREREYSTEQYNDERL